MKTVFHKADTRGHVIHGWLDSYHTFSFASYFNPLRIQFGVLRVLNDDVVAPGMGFGKHQHDNMEILSIPLEGDLEHKDSMGNQTIIRQGEIQVMSAGTGILHSEFNASREHPVKFLQIWFFPEKRGVEPRYGQTALSSLAKENELYTIISPQDYGQGLWLHQNVFVSMGDYTEKTSETYRVKSPGNGVYLFVIKGEISITNQSQILTARDGMGVWDTDKVTLQATEGTSLLLMEIPMDEKY